MFAGLMELALTFRRIRSLPFHGGRIMVGHVDFEPRKAELVANIGSGRIQIPPDAHAAGPLSGHSSFIRPVFHQNGKSAGLPKDDSAGQCVRNGEVFDGFAFDSIWLHCSSFG
jgi:hypothetical protein